MEVIYHQSIAFIFLFSAYLFRNYLINVDLASLTERSAKPLIFGEDICDTIFDFSTFEPSRDYLRLFLAKISEKAAIRFFMSGKRVFLKRLGKADDYENLEFKFKKIVQNEPVEAIDKNLLISEIFDSASNESRTKLFLCPRSNRYETLFGGIKNFENEISNLISQWTALEVSPEPLMLKILQPPIWPVPEYYGSCGRVIVVEDCGFMLSEFQHAPWTMRSKLAINLIKMALQFTYHHPKFAFYWTDPSPDNIAADNEGNVKLIDLEDVFIVDKFPDNTDNLPDFYTTHGVKHVHCDDCYTFRPSDVCNYQISDHNVLTICREILANTSLTIKGGLLHNPPFQLDELRYLLNECVWKRKHANRFEIADEIIKLLESYSEQLPLTD